MSKPHPQKPSARLPISRRTALRLAMLTGIGAGIATLKRLTDPVGIPIALRWMAQGWQRNLGKPSTVAVIPCANYEQNLLYASLAEGWDQAGGPDVKGKSVLIKPNLADHIANKNVTADSRLLRALIQLLYTMGAHQVTVADGSFLRKDQMPILHGSGLLGVLRELDVPYMDLNHDNTLRPFNGF